MSLITVFVDGRLMTKLPGLRRAQLCLPAGLGLPVKIIMLAASLLPAAKAGGIVATFDTSAGAASFNNTPFATQAETAITSAVSTINNVYTLSGSIPVLFQYNSSLNGGGSTSSTISTVPYNNYKSALQADSASHPANTTLHTAVVNLPSSLLQTITLNATFMNQVMGQALTLCYNASGSFVNTCGQQYVAVVTVSTGPNSAAYYSNAPGYNSQAVDAAEHELDEVLGAGGMGSTLKSTSIGAPTSYGPTDLYRYASSGTGATACTTAGGLTTSLSWNTSTTAVACYSITAGASTIQDQNGNYIQFNQSGGGADYGDFATTGANVQNAFVSASPVLAYTQASPEALMLESIGYNVQVTATPEPATGVSVALALGAVAARRRRSHALAKAIRS